MIGLCTTRRVANFLIWK